MYSNIAKLAFLNYCYLHSPTYFEQLHSQEWAKTKLKIGENEQ